MNQATRGASSELVAAVFLLEKGYVVFRNVSPSGLADLVAFREGRAFLVDVKTANRARFGGRVKDYLHQRLTETQEQAMVKLLFISQDGQVLNPAEF